MTESYVKSYATWTLYLKAAVQVALTNVCNKTSYIHEAMRIPQVLTHGGNGDRDGLLLLAKLCHRSCAENHPIQLTECIDKYAGHMYVSLSLLPRTVHLSYCTLQKNKKAARGVYT